MAVGADMSVETAQEQSSRTPRIEIERLHEALGAEFRPLDG